jgi:hypothetical protein
MADLQFSIKLKEKTVVLNDGTSVEKKYKLKELTGDQRAKYNENFDMKMVLTDGKATAEPGENFKMPTAKDFLELCFYDEKDELVSSEFIGGLPSTVQEGLLKAAQKLSGLDPESVQQAKNALEENGSSGTG